MNIKHKSSSKTKIVISRKETNKIKIEWHHHIMKIIVEFIIIYYKDLVSDTLNEIYSCEAKSLYPY